MKLTFVCAVKNLVVFNLKNFRLSRFVVLYKESHVATVWQLCGTCVASVWQVCGKWGYAEHLSNTKITMQHARGVTVDGHN